MKSKIINASIIITAILCSFVTSFFFDQYFGQPNGGGNNNNGLEISFNYVNSTPSSAPAGTSEFINVINSSKTSSVAITCLIPGEDNYYYGSGVFLNELDGYAYIMTNHHVVSQSYADEIYISVYDDDENMYPAQFVGASPNEDIAILRVDKTLIPVGTTYSYVNNKIRDLNTSPLMQGETVFSIGNPLTLSGTVTIGNIAYVNRDIGIEWRNMTLTQYSMSINSGNSGGAVYDYSGNLIGIANAGVNPEAGSQIGFGIDIATAMGAFQDIMTTFVNSPIHGVGYANPFKMMGGALLSSAYYIENNTTKYAPAVYAIDSHYANAFNGFAKNDIIYSITIGETTYTSADLVDNEDVLDALSNVSAGTDVTIVVKRQSGNLSNTFTEVQIATKVQNYVFYPLAN